MSVYGITKQTIFHFRARLQYYLSTTNYKPLILQLQAKKFFTHDQQKKYPGKSDADLIQHRQHER
jgi:hypothetical protein